MRLSKVLKRVKNKNIELTPKFNSAISVKEDGIIGTLEELTELSSDCLLIEKKIPNEKFKGLYFDNIIVIDKEVKGKEYNEVLAEEIGHHYTSAGNILDYQKIENIKQEVKARRFGIELIITLDGLVEAWRLGLHNLYEVAEHFEVRQSYVLEALNHYKVKYNNVAMHNGYRITFDPLHIMIYKEVH